MIQHFNLQVFGGGSNARTVLRYFPTDCESKTCIVLEIVPSLVSILPIRLFRISRIQLVKKFPRELEDLFVCGGRVLSWTAKWLRWDSWRRGELISASGIHLYTSFQAREESTQDSGIPKMFSLIFLYSWKTCIHLDNLKFSKSIEIRNLSKYFLLGIISFLWVVIQKSKYCWIYVILPWKLGLYYNSKNNDQQNILNRDD